MAFSAKSLRLSAIEQGSMSSPFLSIVTVSLNAEATIEDTIASVANQKLSFGIEHICVDGGSRDRTRAIIDTWAVRSPYLRRIYEPDTGIFDAMNKGLRACTGEYVLFLNSDDVLIARGVLAEVMRCSVSGSPSNPDLIACHVIMGQPERFGVWRHRRVPKLLTKRPGWGLFPVHQGLIAKKSLLQLVGGFDADLRLAADVTLYYDLERKMRPAIRRIDRDLAFMRAGGAANSDLCAMIRGSMEIYRHLVATHTGFRAASMVLVKTIQSISEIRLGHCRRIDWFVQPSDRPGVPSKPS